LKGFFGQKAGWRSTVHERRRGRPRRIDERGDRGRGVSWKKKQIRKEEGRRNTWREPRRSPFTSECRILLPYEVEAGKGTVAIVIPHADPSFLPSSFLFVLLIRFVLFPNPHKVLSIMRCY